MIINHNIAALNTHRQLSSATGAQSKSMEKLASGMRINKAGDDAAGLAISEKMRGQIRGLDQASKNSQDGISLIATAEGALNETHDILQRMRELATQASNDTNTIGDRGEIQKEMNQLTSEITRIGNTTEFNTQKLIKGNDTPATGAASVVNPGTPGVTGNLAIPSTADVTFTGATLDGKELVVNGHTFNFTTAGAADTDFTDGESEVALGGTAKAAADAFETAFVAAKAGGEAALANLSIVNDGNGKITFTDSTGGSAAVTTDAAATVPGTFTGGTPVSGGTPGTYTFDISTNLAEGETIEIDGTTLTAVTGLAGAGEFQIGLDEDTTAANIAAKLTSGTTNYNVTETGGTITLTQKVATSGSTGPAVTVAGPGGGDYQASLQIGANQGQNFNIQIGDMRSSALGVSGAAAGAAVGVNASDAVSGASYALTSGTDALTDNSGAPEYALDITSSTKASAAIKVLDQAIEKVSGERSKLGAYQNRLEHTINNLNTSSENLTAAESRVRDVDMAKEMMEQTKNSILAQASQAMLAQANQLPQGVLQLLR